VSNNDSEWEEDDTFDKPASQPRSPKVKKQISKKPKAKKQIAKKPTTFTASKKVIKRQCTWDNIRDTNKRKDRTVQDTKKYWLRSFRLFLKK